MKRVLFVFFAIVLNQSCTEAPPVVAPETAEPMSEGPKTNLTDKSNTEVPKLDGTDFTSALKYAQANDTLSMWGSLCAYSKWAKEVHNGSHTLLCPSNKTLKAKGMDVMIALKDKRNIKLLDKLMAAHILKNNVGSSQLNVATMAETIDGRELPVAKGRIGDARYFTMDIYTQHGSIIVIDDVIGFPQEELAEFARKNPQK